MIRTPKIVIAPDSFKGSLSAVQVCDALKEGINHRLSGVKIISLPLSDGGEGFLDTFSAVVKGDFIPVDVSGPLGKPIKARYFITEKDQTAIIEMAEAAGLILLETEERNPFKTSSYGLGQLIRHALERGSRKFIIGIGGSATTDGGAGMAQALGVEFYNDNGNKITDHMNGSLLGRCRHISLEKRHPAVSEADFRVASDVHNPLLGPRGAVYTYSEQKGASREELPILERNMRNFSQLLESTLQRKISEIPGAGAAGGLGAGLMAFLGARLESGIELILNSLKFDKLLAGADLLITGEGKIDRQTLQGKVLSGVSKRAKDLRIPVVAIAGILDLDDRDRKSLGIKKAISLTKRSGSEEMAMKNARQLLFDIGKEIAKTIQKS